MANVGKVDKVVRIVVGAALIALTFVGPFTATLYPWGLIGIVPLATGLVGWCPAYSIFGIKTCKSC
jgi:Inner membrane protein YgaP-like, transmembrane domain